MANPYPWSVEKTFKNKIKIMQKGRLITGLLAFFASVVFSPLALLGFIWARIAYSRVNDSYKVRSGYLMLLSVVLGVLFYGVFKLSAVIGFYGFVSSFGVDSTADMSTVMRNYLINGLPIALAFVAVSVYFWNGYLEYAGKRYLYPSMPNFWEKRKIKMAKKKFENDDLQSNKFEIGVVKTDILPWRQNRRGMVVGTDFHNLKHGYLIGANGTGKTIAAMNIAAEYVDAGWSIIFPDFKGDRKTENMLAAIARERGVPFYSFWSNNTDTGFHYDPLKGVTNMSPASIIITAFDFVTDGPAKYYTDQAEKYLALQFSVLGRFAQLGENESTFDWLLRTVNPDALVTLLKPAMGGRDKEEAAEAKRLAMEIGTIKKTDLSGLEANLSKMVNTIGEKMRPNDNMINFRKTAEEKAIVYFGLPSSGDKIVMRALGALIIRDMVSFTSERQAIVGEDVGTPVLVMPDEASQLQEKAEAMLEILTQGRSARVMLFPAMQTFGSFTEKFIRELLGNSPTSVVLRVSDEVTAARISESMGTMIVRSERRDTRSETDALGSEHQIQTGAGAGTLMDGPRVPVNTIAQLSNQTALVFFPEAASKATVKKPGKARVRGDETVTDIPTTYLFSRQYILAAENDTEVTRQMIKRTLGLEEESLDTSVLLDQYEDIPWADDEPVVQTTTVASGGSSSAVSPSEDESENVFDDVPPMPETEPAPGELAESYEDAVSDEELFDEPAPEIPDQDEWGDSADIVGDVSNDPTADDFVAGDGVVDEGAEWGEPQEKSTDQVESTTDPVQRYQKASPESDDLEGDSVAKKKESRSTSENDDGFW